MTEYVTVDVEVLDVILRELGELKKLADELSTICSGVAVGVVLEKG